MMRQFFLFLTAVVCLIVVVFALGPREPFSGAMTFDATKLGDDLDGYLAETENHYLDIRDGLQKQIIWADSSKREKTDFAVVYIHGFSASLAEVRPVPDDVAASLGGNLYFTRLKGHGRTSSAMAEARADDWLFDVAEAVAIGERLGDRVIVISTSTGSSLVTFLAATRPEWREKIAAYVMISPNFKIAAPTAFLLTWPWARYFVPAIMGDMRGAKAADAKINYGWTLPHSTLSLLPMAKITHEAGQVALSEIKAPALFIYSPNDQVVSTQAIENAILNWGGATESLIVETSGHEANHVIAGDILSPNTTKGVILAIEKWLDGHF